MDDENSKERDWVVIFGLIFIVFMLVIAFPSTIKKEMEYRKMREITGPFYGGGSPP